jgi:hypothetical protein
VGFDINVFSVLVHVVEESWGVYWESWGEGVVGEHREESEEVDDVVGDVVQLQVSVFIEVDVPIGVAQVAV